MGITNRVNIENFNRAVAAGEIKAMVERGASARKIANFYSVSITTVRKNFPEIRRVNTRKKSEEEFELTKTRRFALCTAWK